MPASLAEQLLQFLADGNFHSGQKLAAQLQVSRTLVWKLIQALKATLALDIHAVPGRGYRLAEAVELFSREILERQIASSGCRLDYSLQLHTRIDSTNQYLLDNSSGADAGYRVCLCEIQVKGRGRRGRSWISPFAKNIQLSVGKTLDCSMVNVSGLSIAVAAAVASFLHDTGLNEIAIKWPNDLYVNGRKLGGLLLEVKGEAEGPVKVVVGLGLNLDMSGVQPEMISQPYTDLKTAMPRAAISRNRLAAGLIARCLMTLDQFERQGLNPFLRLFEEFDAYRGEQVSISSGSRTETGIYQGIDDQGNLKLLEHDGIHVFHAGEVSLRKAQ